jgi:hypothetical protein
MIIINYTTEPDIQRGLMKNLDKFIKSQITTKGIRFTYEEKEYILKRKGKNDVAFVIIEYIPLYKKIVNYFTKFDSLKENGVINVEIKTHFFVSL